MIAQNTPSLRSTVLAVVALCLAFPQVLTTGFAQQNEGGNQRSGAEGTIQFPINQPPSQSTPPGNNTGAGPQFDKVTIINPKDLKASAESLQSLVELNDPQAAQADPQSQSIADLIKQLCGTQTCNSSSPSQSGAEATAMAIYQLSQLPPMPMFALVSKGETLDGLRRLNRFALLSNSTPMRWFDYSPPPAASPAAASAASSNALPMNIFQLQTDPVGVQSAPLPQDLKESITTRQNFALEPFWFESGKTSLTWQQASAPWHMSYLFDLDAATPQLVLLATIHNRTCYEWKDTEVELQKVGSDVFYNLKKVTLARAEVGTFPVHVVRQSVWTDKKKSSHDIKLKLKIEDSLYYRFDQTPIHPQYVGSIEADGFNPALEGDAALIIKRAGSYRTIGLIKPDQIKQNLNSSEKPAPTQRVLLDEEPSIAINRTSIENPHFEKVSLTSLTTRSRLTTTYTLVPTPAKKDAFPSILVFHDLTKHAVIQNPRYKVENGKAIFSLDTKTRVNVSVYQSPPETKSLSLIDATQVNEVSKVNIKTTSLGACVPEKLAGSLVDAFAALRAIAKHSESEKASTEKVKQLHALRLQLLRDAETNFNVLQSLDADIAVAEGRIDDIRADANRAWESYRRHLLDAIR